MAVRVSRPLTYSNRFGKQQATHGGMFQLHQIAFADRAIQGDPIRALVELITNCDERLQQEGVRRAGQKRPHRNKRHHRPRIPLPVHTRQGCRHRWSAFGRGAGQLHLGDQWGGGPGIPSAGASRTAYWRWGTAKSNRSWTTRSTRLGLVSGTAIPTMRPDIRFPRPAPAMMGALPRAARRCGSR